MKQMSERRIVGTRNQVQEQAGELIDVYQADEMLAVCNAYHFQDRVRSFEIFANAMGAARNRENTTETAAA